MKKKAFLINRPKLLVYSVTIHNQRRFIHPQKYGLFQSSIRSKRELMTKQPYLHMHNWWRNFIMFCYSIICFAIRSDKICCISSLSMHGNEINHFRRKKLYICNILYQFEVVFLWTVKNRHFDFTCIAFQNVSWQLLWNYIFLYIPFFRFNNSHLYYKFWKLMSYFSRKWPE